MTYEQALTYIHSTPNFARAAGLHRMQALLQILGNPQDQLQFVHIAGTNGKGSTAAMVARVLEAAGYRTGLYTSPYLQDFRERIRLNSALIDGRDLAEITAQVAQAVQTLTARGVESPNEFELVTAIAFCWYARQKADLVVLEVGLGGRYDATNVILPPVACGITSISLDHTGVLGDTVQQIAREKAGILKAGSVCVVAPGQAEEVGAVICETATRVGCKVVCANRQQVQVTESHRQGLRFVYGGQRYSLPLLGAWQADNLCTALQLVQVLRQRGYTIPDRALAEGLAQVCWPGRMELLCGGSVLLDCCHNPDGIAALCRELDTTFRDVPVTAVMGMLADKDYATGLQLVARRSCRFFAVAPPSPRALQAEAIALVAGECCPEVTACSSLRDALGRALSAREPEGLVVVCGSIPLVGEARTLLTEEKL